mmetsp:Transcript_65282/g.143093  ORF Transcript_65282/g.143093 Transcript_65282/m.143093 type:complete len:213 (-) Transcript_65282:57-695(-)
MCFFFEAVGCFFRFAGGQDKAPRLSQQDLQTRIWHLLVVFNLGCTKLWQAPRSGAMNGCLAWEMGDCFAVMSDITRLGFLREDVGFRDLLNQGAAYCQLPKTWPSSEVHQARCSKGPFQSEVRHPAKASPNLRKGFLGARQGNPFDLKVNAVDPGDAVHDRVPGCRRFTTKARVLSKTSIALAAKNFIGATWSLARSHVHKCHCNSREGEAG